MKHIIVTIFAVAILSVTSIAQNGSTKPNNEQTGNSKSETAKNDSPKTVANTPLKLSEGVKIFIAPMVGDLHPFITSEIIKEKLPITLVTEEAEAEYILAGTSIKADSKWYDSAFGTGKDKNEGSVRLIDAKKKVIVWAGEAGDRSLLFSGFRRGGQRKVADRIVNQMKKDLFKK